MGQTKNSMASMQQKENREIKTLIWFLELLGHAIKPKAVADMAKDFLEMGESLKIG